MSNRHIDEIVDSPDRSVAEHVHRYLTTDGQDGYLEGGVPNLLLTARGRTSGRKYRTALFFGEDAGRHVVVASGSDFSSTHPSWYLNAMASPEVRVQIRGEVFTALARTAEGHERERLWELMTGIAPAYHTYAARSGRIIPVVVLERT